MANAFPALLEDYCRAHGLEVPTSNLQPEMAQAVEKAMDDLFQAQKHHIVYYIP